MYRLECGIRQNWKNGVVDKLMRQKFSWHWSFLYFVVRFTIMFEVVFISWKVDQSPYHRILLVSSSDEIIFELVLIQTSFFVFVMLIDDVKKLVFFFHEWTFPVLWSKFQELIDSHDAFFTLVCVEPVINNFFKTISQRFIVIIEKFKFRDIFGIFFLKFYGLFIEEEETAKRFSKIAIFNGIYILDYINFVGRKFVNFWKILF